MSIQIRCPACGGNVVMDTRLLLAGHQFTCGQAKCRSSISISAQSREVVQHAVDEYQSIRQQTVGSSHQPG
ncbi:hypothetical protein [Endozoicomonas lisbonensis]|uniref:Zinc finger Ogr/Delta-type domain-containing protein n=1 Tax=Endozoicomonas lisbonensis TaxID=3120522 RepID=A0ABV2SBT7_9GAMM